MTERERWTVYPLLLFSLALQFKDKVVPARQIEAQQIVCDRLEVRESAKAQQVEARQGLFEQARTPNLEIVAGKDQIYGRLGAQDNGGFMDLFDGQGILRAKIGPPPGQTAYLLGLFQDDKTPKVVFTEQNGAGFGVLYDMVNQPHFVITARINQPALPEPPADPAQEAEPAPKTEPAGEAPAQQAEPTGQVPGT